MKVVIAPDKFKGSLSASQVCDAIEKGIKQFDSTIETVKHPLADGGEGTLDILQNYFPLEIITIKVKDPLFRSIDAAYMISGNTAFIEMANASGLQLLKKEDQNCYHTSTFGTGELIADAIDKGANEIILFIGGSATNDAGIGMASALGYQFLDVDNEPINPIGSELIRIAKIDDSEVKINFKKVKFTVVCDVKNLLFGPNGAAYVYGKQKGASDDEIYNLDLGLMNFGSKVHEHLFRSVESIEGGGAAGGLGAGAVCFLNAKMQSGIDFVLEQTKFRDVLKNADLIITGEGSADKQTLEGKVIKGVSDVAKEKNIPFAIIAGIVKDKNVIEKSINPVSINSIMDLNVTFEDAIKNAATFVKNIATEVVTNFQNHLKIK
ncbi:glycerate kinase [uncultured Lutibacter sp.]|uniref:glycerate kinase n=1 Tax=uncultured Lutibacter sp. TaxID=437739 RepID=UPI002611BF82|nr:glycerate kinase [uncultured Lutibacter sp.]